MTHRTHRQHGQSGCGAVRLVAVVFLVTVTGGLAWAGDQGPKSAEPTPVGTLPGSPAGRCVIVQPKNESEVAGVACEVRGLVSQVPSTRRLWLCVQPIMLDVEYPQSRLRLGPDGSFLAKVFLGREGEVQDVGEAYRISVYALDRDGAQSVDRYFKEAEERRTFSGVRPSDAWDLLCSVTVRRTR